LCRTASRRSIQAGEHDYLITAADPDGDVEFGLRVTPPALAQLGLRADQEASAVRVTAAYLIARQPVIDLPGQLDLDDVIAAYDDFADQLAAALH
jgi:hypothetical protein